MFAFEAVKSESYVKHFFFSGKKEGKQLKGTVAFLFFFLISLVHLASGVLFRLTSWF